MTARQTWTVGQVAAEVGVTVRTLHHYDDIALVVPSERSPAGYRLYTQDDLTRLERVVVYRRLGFGLEQIAVLMDAGADRETVVEHLRRRRASVADHIGQLQELTRMIDRALEDEMNDPITNREEQREIRGEVFDDELAAEAEQRWGQTSAWVQSQRRTADYGTADWRQIKAEQDAVNNRLVELLRAGESAESTAAIDVAEEARVHIDRWFYDCSRQMHAELAALYVTDERFSRTYEDLAAGLSQFVHDAVVANAARG